MEIVHGTAVELVGKAVLIKGRSGSGKSSLALKLVGMGAHLIADDRVEIIRTKSCLFLRAPKSLPQGIEIRGVGIAKVPICPKAPLELVVNLDEIELKRIPDLDTQRTTLLGYSIPFLRLNGIKNSDSIIYTVLKYGILDL